MNELIQQLLNLGREAFANGDYNKAESYLIQVLKHSRVFADVHNMLGVIYYHRNQYQKARASFEEALKINPKYVDAAVSLAVTYNELGMFDEAHEVYNKTMSMAALQKKEGDLDPYVKSKIANGYMAIGDMWVEQGDLERAKAEYQRALDIAPTYQDIRTKLAICFRDTGNIDEAERLLKVVVTERPRYIKGRIELGLLLFSLKKYEDAAAQWEEVLKIDFSNKSARMYLRLVQGKLEEKSETPP